MGEGSSERVMIRFLKSIYEDKSVAILQKRLQLLLIHDQVNLL